jgi:hypothetical protein
VNEIKVPLLGNARLRHPVTVVTHGPTDLHDWMDACTNPWWFHDGLGGW